jgi:hypothetical protein
MRPHHPIRSRIPFHSFNHSGFNSPPLAAYNAFEDTPLLCGGEVHWASQIKKENHVLKGSPDFATFERLMKPPFGAWKNSIA